ncbi:MAG: hypothetical protein KDA69_11195 [Planctomycetaceae bacterium]|nr:hypothetical protein [Planctomycetaceae bacterium]
MKSPPRVECFQSIIAVVAIAVGVLLSLVTCIGWLFPVEVFQAWASRQAPPDDLFAQFEFIGRGEAIWWMCCFLAPLGVVASAVLFAKRAAVAPVIVGAIDEIFSHTSGRLAIVRRLAILAAILVGVVHLAGGVWQRVKDWPYYRLSSGETVLPNISESNREVIRYLQQTTPEDSTIFIASDQKLYFLSYYLWPRKVVHRMHPEAEHLIPRANQARQLAAYRLKELPQDVVLQGQPDFIVEYFEGPEFVEPERHAEDARWLRFTREVHRDSNYTPPYLFTLTPAKEWKPR